MFATTITAGTQANLPIVQMGFGGLGPWEMGIILVLVLVVFGAGKLPTIGSSMGEAIKNFKKGMKGDDKNADPGPEKDKK